MAAIAVKGDPGPAAPGRARDGAASFPYVRLEEAEAIIENNRNVVASCSRVPTGWASCATSPALERQLFMVSIFT